MKLPDWHAAQLVGDLLDQRGWRGDFPLLASINDVAGAGAAGGRRRRAPPAARVRACPEGTVSFRPPFSSDRPPPPPSCEKRPCINR